VTVDVNVLALEGVLAANRGVDAVVFLRDQTMDVRARLDQRLTRAWEGKSDDWVYDFCMGFLGALREEMEKKCSCGRVGTWSGDLNQGEPEYMCDTCVVPYLNETETEEEARA
jgi:hypothetical protein